MTQKQENSGNEFIGFDVEDKKEIISIRIETWVILNELKIY